MEMTKSSAQFSFSFGGGSEIEATLLARIINDTVELTKAISHEVEPEAFLKMNITTFRAGSFDVEFSAVCEQANTLKLAVGVLAFQLAPTIVNTLKGILEIKKLLKDTSAKSITPAQEGFVDIENNSGQVINAPKASLLVVENFKVEQLVVNISSGAMDHDSQGGFTFRSDEGEVVCTAEDILGMCSVMPRSETVSLKSNVFETYLQIKKPDFIGSSMWEFLHMGKAIRASIDDEEWLDRVHSGQVSIKAGDGITVLLEVRIDLDTDGTPKEDTVRYFVQKVLRDVHPLEDQIRLS
ncbi:MAG: hypothetical protein FWE76_08740 [Symbiobacteriaceae bacterium]|nr:hypothetical protein [Symbiobacteriaceae bacterium]